MSWIAHRLVVVAATLAMGSGLAVPSSASEAAECTATQTWTFDPPLGLASTEGTVRGLGLAAVCVSATGALLSFASWPDYETTYSGNCEIAIIGGGRPPLFVGTPGVLVGGVSFSETWVEASDGRTVLLKWEFSPDAICNEAQAAGVGVGTAVTV